MKTTPKIACYISIVIAAILWGSVGIFFHFLSEYALSRMEIILIRTSVAAVLLFLYLLIADRKKLKIRLRDLWMFFGTGVVSLLAFNYCYFTAMELTSLSVAAVLLYTAPAFVTILSVLFFKERLTGRKIIALFLTLPGCAIVSGLFGSSTPFSWQGILFGLGSGFCYALYTIFSRIALVRYDNRTISFYTFLFAGIGSAFLCTPLHVVSVLSTPPALLLGIGLSVATCLLPYLLYTYGLSKVGNSEASVTATVEPVAATFISVCFLGEPMTWQKGIGMLFIISAVVIINVNGKSRPTSPPAVEGPSHSVSK